MDVKVGDKVLYSKYGGTEVHYEGVRTTSSSAPATFSPSSAD